MKYSQGFSIVELIVAVGIVCTLAALAIPTYQDYSVRAKVAEVFDIISKDKASIAEYYFAKGTMPTSAQSGVNLARAQSRYFTANIRITRSGTSTANLTYTLGNMGKTTARGTIIFVGLGTTSGVTWTCTGGTFPATLRPAKCRP